MNQLATGLHFTCPRQDIHHQQTNDAFVDDVTGYTNQFTDELQGMHVENKVIHLMQQDATLWSRLLHISGGKLALQKCLYYIVAWKWNRKGATMKPPNTIQPKIVLHNNNTVTPIQHLNPNQAHRTLGQYKAPDGNQSKHFDYMVTKSSKWLVAIKEA